MSYRIAFTAQFKKDYRRMKRRGADDHALQTVIDLLAAGEPLPANYKDHLLSGNYVGLRECHIKPDWLLVYRKEADILVLTLMRTGTHSDLF